MTSHTLYLQNHRHCIYDKTRPMFTTSYWMYMTSPMVHEWQYNHGIHHHTQCICVIPPTWLMISQTIYVWNLPHCMQDTIGTIYDITSSLDSIIPLFVCHGTHYVYDIISTVYDVTHTVCITTQALYLTWNPFCLLSFPLYISSHPLCRRHHTIHVIYHRWHMCAIMCTIHVIISTLYDNNP